MKPIESERLRHCPSTWPVCRLKHLARLTGGGTPSKDVIKFWEGGTVPWVSPKDMKRRVIAETQDYVTEAAVRSSATSFVPPGAPLIVVRSGILRHSLPVAIAGCRVTLNQDMKAFQLDRRLDAEFFAYWLEGQAQELLLEWRQMGATVESIDVDEMMDGRIALPDLATQRAVVAFLDRELARNDRLIDRKTRFIELLKEKRQALISHVVTKGLNPDTRVKDSGVKWLGCLPANWKVVALQWIALSKCDGPFGSGLKSSHYVGFGTRVIRLQNVRETGFDGSDEAFVEEAYARTELARHEVAPGDVLIAGLGDNNNPVGRACVAPSNLGHAIVKADCFRFRLDPRIADPEFVALQLSATARDAAMMLANGSTRARIPLSSMSGRKVALPPLNEQLSIVRHLKALTARIDATIEKTAESIKLLRERRSALITAAVTGKIDVRREVDSEALEHAGFTNGSETTKRRRTAATRD